MRKIKEKFSLGLVAVAYLLFNVRYAPGRWADSLAATGMQLLTTAPYVFGLAFVVVSFIQRATGEKLPWDRALRIYFTIGIIIGFLYALSDYWLSA